jgi:hypothetical protein
MTKDVKFFEVLFPSHPDFEPIIKSLQDKYGLERVDPEEGEPISELYLADELISLADFRQEIENLVRENLSFFPPKFAKLYATAKKYHGQKFDFAGFESLPDESKNSVKSIFDLSQNMMGFYVRIGDAQIKAVVEMLYVHLLMGEDGELPNDWFGKVAVSESDGEKTVIAMASQLSNPEVIVEQFRKMYHKYFGAYRPKITNLVVTTAYYMRLKRMGKPWNFVVEEYIKRNKISLPRDRTSKRYFDIRSREERKLRKRIQRAEKILNVLVEDKK